MEEEERLIKERQKELGAGEEEISKFTGKAKSRGKGKKGKKGAKPKAKPDYDSEEEDEPQMTFK